MKAGIPVQMYMSVPAYSAADLQQCIRACMDAVYQCERSITRLMLEGDDDQYADCVKACRDCALMCVMCVKVVERGSIVMLDMVEICTETCQQCALECMRCNGPACDRCAAACQRCAEVCLALLAKAAA